MIITDYRLFMMEVPHSMMDYKIYPKQFMSDKVHVDKSRCFMIMPFSADYRGIYAEIKAELGDMGIVCNRVDEIRGSKPIMNKIITEILKSRYIIAELSECNANVFYELGIAHSFRDSRNILLLKQKNSKYPFDLSHLPYVEYSPDNTMGLREIVKRFINESMYAADFVDALNLHGISVNTVDGRNNYIEYVQDQFESQVDDFTKILNEDRMSMDIDFLVTTFNSYENFICEAMLDQTEEIIYGLIRIYSVLLSCCSREEIIKKYVARFLEHVLSVDVSYEEHHLAWKTDMMLSLARRGKALDICMPWIIGYFSRSKSSNIDLNRYKLEKFLVETENEKINDMIIEAIYDNDCHIREHMSDIIGIKSLKRACGTLIRRLRVEENYFTISSIVEAIGRIAPSDEGIDAIEEWIAAHGKEIIAQNQAFIFKHLYRAIARLDKEEHPHLKAFMQEYGDKFQQNRVGPIDSL